MERENEMIVDSFTAMHDPYHAVNLINDGAEAPENLQSYKSRLRRNKMAEVAQEANSPIAPSGGNRNPNPSL